MCLINSMNSSNKNDGMLRSIFDTANDAIIVINQSGTIVEWNNAAERIMGYTVQEQVGTTLLSMIPERHRKGHEEGLRRFNGTGQTKWIGHTVEVTAVRKDGNEIPIELSLAAFSSGEDTYFTGIIRDITERTQAEVAIQRMIYYDELTGLPNRRFFNETISNTLEEARQHNTMVALLFLDLDHFKAINDSYGHEVGDDLLRQVARRLQEYAGPGAIISRISGDEFTIILSGIHDHSDATEIAEKIIQSFNSEAVLLNDRDVFITVSVGISFFPDDGLDVFEIVRHADIAMYRSKAVGRNGYRLSLAEVQGVASEIKKMQLERCLSRAISMNDEFSLVYQPKIDSSSVKTVGLEALLRWNSAELGIIAPSDFIPIAEDTGLIVPIGEWVLKHVCAQYVAWKTARLQEITVSINISVRQLEMPNFVERVREILTYEGLDGHWLEFEITENLFLQNHDDIIRTLQELRKMGIKISIDDFGTGFSCLFYLKSLPIDVLKIDQSFIRGLNSDEKDEQIVSVIISLAHSLNLKVIAEGVENETQRVFLTQRQCEQMQGYLFSKPLPASNVLKWFNKQSFNSEIDCN